MRATCEHCGGAQPRDWAAGDACIHCGKSVRRDLRCFWCAAWVPAGGFCRSCGAAVVDYHSYGVARMLKDGGVDRFSVPKMLAEMDASQRENMERIYQQQAALVARQVDDVLFLERFLFQEHWSAALDDELTEQLPWPRTVVQKFSVPPLPLTDNAQGRVKAIGRQTPVPLVGKLASIARLRLDDWTAFDEVNALFDTGDDTLRAEAALALTGWRVRYGVERAPVRGSREPKLVEELRRSPFRVAAAVRLALLGEKVELPREAIGSEDHDVSMALALATDDTAGLTAALRGDRLERLAAGLQLAAIGHLAPLADLFRDSDDDLRFQVLHEVAMRSKGAPELRDVLLDILERHEDERMREHAARVLCRACRQEDGLRIVRASRGDSRIVQSVLQVAGLDTAGLEEVCEYLVANRRFSMGQFGLPALAEKGLLKDAFVPKHFPRVEDDETRKELCRFAELQLVRSGDEELHRFVMNVAFGEYTADVRGAAWWCLHRWYLGTDIRGENPAALRIEPATRFFGSPGEFARKVAAMLEDPPTLLEVGLYEDLERLLKGARCDAMRTDEAAFWRLAEAVKTMMRNSEAAFTLRTAGAEYLATMGENPAWRARARAILDEFAGTDIAYACTQALQRVYGTDTKY